MFGAISFPLLQAITNSGHYPNYVAAGDFNNDGWPDFAVLNSLDVLRSSSGTTQGSIDVFLNKNGTFAYKERGFVCFTAPCPQNYGAGTSPTFISTADLNGDGNLDLVVSDRDNTNAYILLGKGDGLFNGSTQPAKTRDQLLQGTSTVTEISIWPMQIMAVAKYFNTVQQSKRHIQTGCQLPTFFRADQGHRRIFPRKSVCRPCGTD